MTGAEFMQPVFHFLDNAIRDYGHYLYMGLVYVSLPLMGWVLSGGLRPKHPAAHISIVLIQTPPRPPPLPPPLIGNEPDPFPEDDGDSFAA